MRISRELVKFIGREKEKREGREEEPNIDFWSC